jgi:hypothetical protein
VQRPRIADDVSSSRSSATSFWQSEFLWLVATLWPAGRSLRREREPRPERGHGFPSVAVATIAFAVVFVTLAPPIASRLLALAGEPWYQTAAALEIRLHGMPPQDPTFAGMPFYHPWLPPFLLALVRAATGASAFGLQVILAGWAAGVWTLAIAQVAYRAFGRAAATAAAAIAVLGLNPIGWLLWLLRPAGSGGGALDKLMELSGAGRREGTRPGLPRGRRVVAAAFLGRRRAVARVGARRNPRLEYRAGARTAGGALVGAHDVSRARDRVLVPGDGRPAARRGGGRLVVRELRRRRTKPRLHRHRSTRDRVARRMALSHDVQCRAARAGPGSAGRVARDRVRARRRPAGSRCCPRHCSRGSRAPGAASQSARCSPRSS